jgi:hypothetical protein
MAFKFSNAKAATSNQYLNPGIYKLKVTEVTKDKFSQKGTPYLGIKFENEDGLSFVEKFSFGTDKSSEVALTRLQYIHVGFFGKECSKDFNTLDEVVNYFRKALLEGKKTIVKTIVVGGNESGNNVFACLPYAGFILEGEDEENAELGEFDPGSKEYKKVVKKNTSVSEVADRPNGILNDSDGEEIGAKKNGAKASAVVSGKKATDDSKQKEEDDDDDMPW